MAEKIFYRESEGVFRFQVKVQPRASRNKICGPQGDALKIQLTAPPVDGAANSALIAFLAESLHTAKQNITIVSGAGSRHKLVQIKGVESRMLQQTLALEQEEV